MKKAAIYARSAFKNPESIGRQTDGCKQSAVEQNLEIKPDNIYVDDGESGRPAFQALLAAIQETPRPFEVILMEDTSRLARNHADVLHILKTLRKHEVDLYFVDDKISAAELINQPTKASLHPTER